MKCHVRFHWKNNLVIVLIFYNSYRIVCDVCVCTSEKKSMTEKMFGKNFEILYVRKCQKYLAYWTTERMHEKFSVNFSCIFYKMIYGWKFYRFGRSKRCMKISQGIFHASFAKLFNDWKISDRLSASFEEKWLRKENASRNSDSNADTTKMIRTNPIRMSIERWRVNS